MNTEINVTQCPFHKTNNVTIIKNRQAYDTYKCTRCGKNGKRHGLSAMVTVNGKCKFPPNEPKKERPSQVKLIGDQLTFNQFGFVVGSIHDVVKCPDEYKGKFDKDVWVYSERRHEPVRLLSNEYESIQ